MESGLTPDIDAGPNLAELLSPDEIRLLQTALRAYRSRSVKTLLGLTRRFGKNADLTGVQIRIELIDTLCQKFSDGQPPDQP